MVFKVDRKLFTDINILHQVLKLFSICIRTRRGMYSQIYPFAWRSFQGQSRGTPVVKEIYFTYIPSGAQYIILSIIRLMITSIISLAISLYTPSKVYCKIYPFHCMYYWRVLFQYYPLLAGLLLASSGGLWPSTEGLFALSPKKTLLCCFGQFFLFLVSSINLGNF